MSSRVVVLADGEVGARVVQLLADRSPSSLVGVGTVGTVGTEVNVASLPASVVRARWTRENGAGLAAWIRSLAPDLVLLAWWPFIVRADVLGAGQRATLNLHPSLLGYGRGKDPNFWALANQDPFGVTIHHVTEGVDDGPIAFQAEVPYGWTDTGETLYRRGQDAMVNLVSERLDDILALRLPVIEQSPDAGPTRRRADLDVHSRFALDETTTARALLNLLRARTFLPHAGCRFESDGRDYEVRISILPVNEALQDP